MYSNVDQLLNKIDDLKMMISTDDPDILLLTEVIPKAQKNEIFESQLHLSGYKMYVNFDLAELDLGSSGKRGVAIYTKDYIRADIVKMTTEYNDHLWVDINLKGEHLLCGVVYRSPNKDKNIVRSTTKAVCDLITEAATRNRSRLLICGDFNYPGIDWDCEFTGNEETRPFLDAVQSNYLYQHVCKPTRYRDGHEPSLLDLILSSEEGMVYNLKHNPGVADSDHETLSFILPCSIDSPKHTLPQPNYFKADYATIRNRLQQVDWSTKLQGDFSECTSLMN